MLPGGDELRVKQWNCMYPEVHQKKVLLEIPQLTIHYTFLCFYACQKEALKSFTTPTCIKLIKMPFVSTLIIYLSLQEITALFKNFFKNHHKYHWTPKTNKQGFTVKSAVHPVWYKTCLEKEHFVTRGAWHPSPLLADIIIPVLSSTEVSPNI